MYGLQAAVSQFLFVGHNFYICNAAVARESCFVNMDSRAPLKPIAMDKWIGVLVRALSDLSLDYLL